MNKEELARQYADKKTIDCYNSRFGLSNHDLHVKKSYDLFTGYDIEQAYEDGFDKAVEFACEFLYEQLNNGTMECGNIEEFIEDFKKYMNEV